MRFAVRLQKISIFLGSLSAWFSGAPVFAATYYYAGNKETIPGYIVLIMQFVNDLLLPFIFSIALLFFLVNVVRFFILEGEDREHAREFALYGIAAFVIMVSLWGVVNLLVDGLGFNGDQAICPDYLTDWCNNGSGGNYGNSGGSFNIHIQF